MWPGRRSGPILVAVRIALGRRPTVSSSANGGVAARRAVARWALRLYRREWRQQVLVLALLTVSVAAAIGIATAAYNTAGVAGNASFGSANHRYTLDDPDLDALDEGVAAATERFGPVDVIARWSGPIPGSVESLEVRAHDPAGPFSEPMLALHDGRYPTAPGEVALTDGVAELLQADVGGTVDIDGQRRRVVGVVENPSDLHEEFALVPTTEIGAAESVTILIGGSGDFDEVAALRDFGDNYLPNADITSRQGEEHASSSAAVAVLGTATVAMVLVSLIAAAGFVAVAQRRQRQLGMLGAIGATEKHLRFVVVVGGAATGILAATVGVTLGLLGWIVAAPRLEASVGHRIDPSNIPWWVVTSAAALAVTTSTIAAWWPARTVARLPITGALSGRPPRPQPARHSATMALILFGVGISCLILADQDNSLLIVAGTLATVAGVLLLSPIAISALSAAATRCPVGIRIALRDLARHQARTGLALAAIALALGIQVATVVTATAAENSIGLANLSANQLLVWTRDEDAPEGVSPFYTQDENDDGFSPFIPAWSPEEQRELERDVDEIAALLTDPTVINLKVASDPDVPADPGVGGRVAVTLAQQTDIGYLDIALLYVATDDLLERFGVAPEQAAAGADVLTRPPSELATEQARDVIRSDDLFFANLDERPTPITDVQLLPARQTSLPRSLITENGLLRRGWEAAPVGWLLESTEPISAEALVAARDIAADAGALIEAHRPQPDLTTERWVATGMGMLLALGILAMTVGLIRSQAAADLRALTATGASSGIRRTLSAATAGGLAMLGAILGMLGAYAALAAGYFSDPSSLLPVPVANLVAVAIGIPAVAAVAGWLIAGREPPAIARQAIE
jgi:putative ABC transport system permease protein